LKVKGLFVYPVKSMRGTSLDEVAVDAIGLEGDRRFGVHDVTSGTVLTAKREGRLLEAVASLGEGGITVTLPGGETRAPGAELDEALCRWLGREVRLVEAATFGAAVFEGLDDFERDDSPLHTWEGVAGSFVDATSLHVLGTGELERLAAEKPELQWDLRRFRPNVMVDDPDDELSAVVPGMRIAIGDLEIAIEGGCVRCVMTTRSQPDGLHRELDILRHVASAHDTVVGMLARVVVPGTVRVGDDVRLLD
jgi:uncharacterized protein